MAAQQSLKQAFVWAPSVLAILFDRLINFSYFVYTRHPDALHQLNWIIALEEMSKIWILNIFLI